MSQLSIFRSIKSLQQREIILQFFFSDRLVFEFSKILSLTGRE